MMTTKLHRRVWEGEKQQRQRNGARMFPTYFGRRANHYVVSPRSTLASSDLRVAIIIALSSSRGLLFSLLRRIGSRAVKPTFQRTIKMTCVSDCIKYLLYFFNFAFCVCGLGILSLGVVIHLRVVNLSDHLETNLSFPSITLIVLGSIIFVISFFGCCGAIRESHCMTITFASLLLFILLVQVAVAVYAFVVIRSAEKQINITENYKALFGQYYTKKDNREVVDFVQSSLQCCGITGPKDFEKFATGTIPWSCCNKQEGDTCTLGESSNEGCVEAIKVALTTAGAILGGFAIGVAGVELIGIIFALCLANSIKNSERRGYRV